MAQLTQGYDLGLELMMAQTVPGMAHWAGSGPPGECCFRCQHWGHTEAPSGVRYRRAVDGALKPKRCWKSARLSNGKIAHHGVPAIAWA
jgi:hypothetical protein